MIQIKNLADFKRAIKTGAKLETIHHLNRITGKDENGKFIYEPKHIPAREVKTVQTNAFTLLTEKKGTAETVFIESWLQYPKAKQFRANGTDTIQILETNRDGTEILILTYKFI
jgi:hypothetical protein